MESYVIAAIVGLLALGALNRLAGTVLISVVDVFGIGLCAFLYWRSPDAGILPLKVAAVALLAALGVEAVNRILVPRERRASTGFFR